MDLSNELINSFVKITNDSTNTTPKESTVYGTAVEYNGTIYVKIDGSEVLTPVETTADMNVGDRVTVMIKNHEATVSGNVTAPSTNEETVERVVQSRVEGVDNRVSQIEQTASKINWIVEDGTDSSSMTLTDEVYELITTNISLTADKISLHGYISANGGFSIDEEGSMKAVNGAFEGSIKGSSYIEIGSSQDKSRPAFSVSSDGTVGIGNTAADGTNPSFWVSNIGNLKIGGLSAHTHSDGLIKGIAEITSLGTIYSCSATEPETYVQISEGKIIVSSTISPEDDVVTRLSITDTITSNRNLHLKASDTIFLVCDGKNYANTEGAAMRYYKNTNSDYVLRPVGGSGKIYLGTATYPWKTVNAVTVNQTSDRSTKENIEYLNDYTIQNAKASQQSNIGIKDCYDFIKNDCILATYNHKNDERKKINFIANDLLVNSDGTDNIIGQLIVTLPNPRDEENAILTFDTTNYISVVVGALQRAIDKIEQLETIIKGE